MDSGSCHQLLNNYGPYQFPEKLIPMINNAMRGDRLPIYGDGGNIRDWLYVEDHCRPCSQSLKKGTRKLMQSAETASAPICRSRTICALLDEISREDGKVLYAEQITFVPDRPGHDRRYAINAQIFELKWDLKSSLTKV